MPPEKKATAFEMFSRTHTDLCGVHIATGSRQCTCGRDAAIAEVAMLKNEYEANEARWKTESIENSRYVRVLEMVKAALERLRDARLGQVITTRGDKDYLVLEANTALEQINAVLPVWADTYPEDKQRLDDSDVLNAPAKEEDIPF